MKSLTIQTGFEAAAAPVVVGMGMNLIRFLILAAIKVLARIFYRFDRQWMGQRPSDPGWRDVRLIVLLNHTSLFEPVFSGILPWSMIWRIASRGIFPAADVTMSRPVAGRLINLLAPKVVPITRRRDESWSLFLNNLNEQDLMLITPEGRMKRPDGLDKFGQPMTVRGGIVDILELIGSGRMLLAYSGGLHHVQAPGQRFPRLFRDIRISMETVDIKNYFSKFANLDPGQRRKAIVADLEHRRDLYCPS